MPGISRCGSHRRRPWSQPSPRMPTATPARFWLRRAGPRADGDLRNEKINLKVREHSLAKVPALLVLGRKEAAERTVSIRRLGSNEQHAATFEEAMAALVEEAVPPDV